MGFSLKKIGKSIERPFRGVGRTLTGAGLGSLGYLINPAVGLATTALGSYIGNGMDAAKAQKKAAAAEEAGYKAMADAMQSQPTANASMTAEAAQTQNVAQTAEEAVQRARKRRSSWASTVNSGALGAGGGLSGRTTLG